jgi:hypothetical protein
MPKVSPAQTNFGGGEFSPLIAGRIDSDRYKTGLKKSLNYLALIQGALVRRPGTKYVAPTRTAGGKIARLQRFEFSTTQAYMLEFTDLRMRVYRNNAAVLESNVNITGATQNNPVVVTAVAHGFSNGDEVEIVGVGGMTQLNGRRFTVANQTANTFELSGINGTGYSAYTSGGTVARVYTVVTPYAEADLFQLKFTQSADVLYVAHPSYKQRKITRTAHTNWTVNIITFLDGPYLIANSTATTITPSATTGNITLTASAALWVSTDVGRLVRIKHSSTWGYATITGFTSSTVVNATVVNQFGAATASANWRLGVWSDTTGYPNCVTFFEDRLVWGGATVSPQRLDASNSGDYENMAPSATDGTVIASHALSFTLTSNDVQNIRWMANHDQGLMVGTVSGEWIVRASTQGEALSPTNISAKQTTFHGSADIQHITAGGNILFVQRAVRKLREVTFTYISNKFYAPDLTVLAEHITVGGVKQMAYMQEPQSIVWAVRNDGTLLALTYERDVDGNVRAAWTPHTLGGFSDAGHTLGAAVESVATIPSADGQRDDVWVVVKRYINGQTVRHVEYITQLFDNSMTQSQMFFVDAGLTYSGAPATVIGGMWHLEGETVSVLADGAVLPDKVVSSGTVTLLVPASTVNLGYSYNSDGSMLRIEAGAADGVALGKLRRAHRVSFLFDRTLGFKFGRDFNNLNEMIFRTTGDDLGVAPPLFTGVKSEAIDMGYDYDNFICWRQSQPTAGTILAIMPQMETQDRG